MKLNFLTLDIECFGLDISDFSIKIVKLGKKGKRLFLESFIESELKAGIVVAGEIVKEKEFIDSLKKALTQVKGKKIKTKNVIVSLPEEKSFLETITMPRMTESELESAMVFEAENHIPLPIKEIYVDAKIVSVSDKQNTMNVLLVASLKKIIDSYFSCLKKAGFNPYAFETKSYSISRSLIKKEEKNSSLVLIDFDKDKTNLVIFSKDTIWLACSIPVCSNKLDSVMEELIDDTKKYIDFYYTHKITDDSEKEGLISKIILSGEGSNLKGLSEFFFKKTGIKTELGNPLDNIITKGFMQKPLISPEKAINLSTAVGLAIRGINRPIN